MNAASPNYSPYSVGFFEGYVQPVANAGLPGFGVGGLEIVKNWMAMFADFDAAMMCGMGDPTKMADDGMGGMLNPNTDHHNYYFNPLTGEPNMTAECSSMSWFSNNPMFGTTGTNAQLQHVIGMMTTTFDQAMGFPAGTAMQMGMYDGVAGIQGFALRELQTGGTLGCNPFAGPISFSPAAGQSVNNCMPNYADPTVAAAIDGMMGAGSAAMYAGMINGTCVGADPGNGVPGACTGGFRNNGACMTDADCSGAMTDMAEIGHNPFGLIYGRAEAQSHFKIDLQQSFNADGSPKVKWAAAGEQNPSNANHVAAWDQAQFCYDYINGANPMQPAVAACAAIKAEYDANIAAGGVCSGNMMGAMPSMGAMDCKLHIVTVQSANQYLGYSDATLALLMSPSVAVANKAYVVTASLSALASPDTDLTVELNASRSACYYRDLDTGVVTDMNCTFSFDADGGTPVGGNGSDIAVVEYPAEGTYNPCVTVTMVDDPATPGDESTVSDTQCVNADAVIVEVPAAAADFATSVSSKTVTLTAPTLDASVVRAYIYWGDRTRTVVTNPANLQAGVNHTYGRGGRSYNIRVTLIDAAHNMTNYTFAEDADLTVAIP